MSTARSRSPVPRMAAASMLSPCSSRVRIAETINTPFGTAWPSSAMKPTAAETDNRMSASASPSTPPTSASGTTAVMMSEANRRPNVENNSRRHD